MAGSLSVDDVNKTSRQAKLTLSAEELEKFRGQFDKTLDVVGELGELDTSKVSGADRITDVKNVFREDIVDQKRMLAQEQALSNVPENNRHKGFFMVGAVFEDKDV